MNSGLVSALRSHYDAGMESPTTPAARPSVPPAVSFLIILAGFALLGVLGLFWKPASVSGLPEDADVAAAADLVRGRLRLPDDVLRLHSTLLGDGEAGELFTARHRAVVDRSDRLLEAARARAPRDPRIDAARAGLALMRRDMTRAERGFRAALARAEGYGEARVGLGAALALRADATSDGHLQRKLLLEAIGQFAAVEERDPAYAAALYDRAVLLDRVGRRPEAMRVAASYLEHDRTSVWAERLWSLGLGGLAPARR